ncbi:MAG: heavy metal-binding domain-containing protein, partial [Thermoguttaceae bacterium]
MSSENDLTREPPTDGDAQPRRPRSITGQLLLVVICIAALFLSAVIGIVIGRHQPTGDVEAAAEEEPEVWICTMDPGVRLPEPGLCPICKMALILLEDDKSGPRTLKMSPAAMALAEVETTAVRRQYVTRPIRMMGKVEYDETRLADITAWVPGRLD